MKFNEFLNSGKMNEDVLSSLHRIVDVLIHAGNVTQSAHWNLLSSAFVVIHSWFSETYDVLFNMAASGTSLRHHLQNLIDGGLMISPK